MADSTVIARRFRPQAFDQVIGQEAITRTLKNALKSGRLHHAYVFTGARGVGKTTTARILAKALNCATGITTEPCGVCPSCCEIASSSSIDVHEIDAASHTGIDNVRDVIISTVQISPARDRYKIFIIDEVHQLSPSAFNALLKTLEEPPAHVVFILATTEMHKVPETILSRCQIFEFRTISTRDIFEQLKQIATELGVKISDRALLAISRAGEGSMRDAESALDQVMSFSGKEVADEDVSTALGLVDSQTLNNTLQAIARQDARQVLRIVDEVVARGYDLRNLCRELMLHIRGLLVVKAVGFDEELLQIPAEESESFVELAESFSEQDLIRFFSILTKTEQDIRMSSQPRFHLEIGLIKLVHAGRLYLLEDALARLADLQSRLGGSGMNTPSASSPKPSAQQSVGPRTASVGGGSRSYSNSRPDVTRPGERTSTTGASRGSPRQAPGAEPSADKLTHRSPDEPPPLDVPYEVEREMPPASISPPPSTGDVAERIKAALQAKGKMLILSALDHAESISEEENTVCIRFAPSGIVFKNQIDSNRTILEEVGREVLGRRVTLTVIAGGEQPRSRQSQANAATSDSRDAVENHPTVRAIIDTFHGELLDVIKPE